MYKFERIESIQFKTELKIKLENPFCVDKKIISFDYNPIINLIKTNLGISSDGFNISNIYNIFRFLTEQLFISISNELNFQFCIINVGQDQLVPILTNAFILSLIGKTKIEKNIFNFIEQNLDELTDSQEKKDIFYLINDLLNIAYSFNYERKKNIKKIVFSGSSNSGKTTLVKKLLNIDNENRNINFYELLGENNDMILIDIPSNLDCIFTNNYIKKIEKHSLVNFIVLDCQNNEIQKNWNNFILKRNWNEKNFKNLLNNLIKEEIKKENYYFINKTDQIDLSFLSDIKTKNLISFLKSFSKYYELNIEELIDMSRQEIIFLTSFIIRCGQYENIYWGSIKNDLNFNKIKNKLIC